MYPHDMANVSKIVFNLLEVPFIFVEGDVDIFESYTPFVPTSENQLDDYDDPPKSMNEKPTQAMLRELDGEYTRVHKNGGAIDIDWWAYFNSNERVYRQRPTIKEVEGMKPIWRTDEINRNGSYFPTESYKNDMERFSYYMVDYIENGEYHHIFSNFDEAMTEAENNYFEARGNPAFHYPYASNDAQASSYGSDVFWDAVYYGESPVGGGSNSYSNNRYSGDNDDDRGSGNGGGGNGGGEEDESWPLIIPIP